MSSFAATVKNELTRKKGTKAEAKAELEALVRMNGSLSLVNQGFVLQIQTENAAIARRIFSLLKSLYHVQAEIVVQRKMKLKKNNVYIVRVRHHVDYILDDLAILKDGQIGAQVRAETWASKATISAYLRGAFLAAGSVNNPETSSYHLEIYSWQALHQEEIMDMCNEYGLNARGINRRGGYITYLKEANKISDFLVLIGAMKAIMRFEDIRVVRDMRNAVNRLVNCENANLNKTVDAAGRQLAMIRYIHDRVGLEALPERLQDVAWTRLKYPDVSMKELGQHVPNGPISKSGVNHRLRKIKKFAEDLEKDPFKGR